jgi:3-oxoacyl-[acyl-carrier protein] reductase
MGTFNMTQLAARHMRTRKYGRIVNFVSRAGLHGTVGAGPYGAGKGGIYGFTNVVFRELAPLGILVNAVNPAATRTRMVMDAVERAKQQGLDPAQAERMLSVVQEPERLAVVVAGLCAEACTVTGQYFFVQHDSIGLFSPISAGKTLIRPGGWTPQEFVDALPGLDIPPPVSIY